MKVLICGGRKFSDWVFLSDTLDRIHAERSFTLVMHGAAPGADTLAESWAASRSIKVKRYPALWASYGRAAGAIRNRVMIDHCPDLVIAFEGARGTADMIKLAEGRSIEVIKTWEKKK